MRELCDQPQWMTGEVDFHLQKGCRFYYRDISSCIRYLLRQKAYSDSLVYEPIREYDMHGKRVYSEMHTATWWWDTQVRTSPDILNQ